MIVIENLKLNNKNKEILKDYKFTLKNIKLVYAAVSRLAFQIADIRAHIIHPRHMAHLSAIEYRANVTISP